MAANQFPSIHKTLLKGQIESLAEVDKKLKAAPDQQISLTAPDARSMSTTGRGTATVGYNVQTAVDTQHHLIVAHEGTNLGHERTQLASIAKQANEVLRKEGLLVFADRGYFSGLEILACEELGVPPTGSQITDFRQPGKEAVRQT